MWGLSAKDLSEIPFPMPENYYYEGVVEAGRQKERNIVQATLRHVYEEGEKPCPHDLPIYEASRPRRLCSLCWAKLKKEAEL